MHNICILAALLALLLLLSPVLGFDRFGKNKPKPKRVPQVPQKPVLLNTDGLPTLQEILEEVHLTAFLPHLLRMGVTETMILLRLTSMDYRIMNMDWEGVAEESIAALKERAAALYLRAVVKDEPLKANFDERNKLKYGRIYVPGAVQSFEFVTASFGGSPPLGALEVFLAPPPYFGCNASDFAVHGVGVSTNPDADAAVAASAPGLLTGRVLVVQRGVCSFLQKALLAIALNATALIVCNNEDRLDSPASGHTIDPNVTHAMMDSVAGLSVLSVSNTSWPKLAFSARHASATHPVMAHVIPLKCGPGGICMPLLAEEKSLQAEVSWGAARFKTSAKEVRSFEYLTSNYGGRLPEDHESLTVVLARPLHGCVEGAGDVEEWAAGRAERDAWAASLIGGGPFALAVVRGQCRFHVKQAWAESLGARLLIIVDVEDSALQRVGGLLPEAGHVGIPSIIITAPAWHFLKRVANSSATTTSVSLSSSLDSSGADKWIELAFTEWAEGDADRLLQIEGLSGKHAQGDQGAHAEIVAWLQRRAVEIEGKSRSKIPTDEHEL